MLLSWQRVTQVTDGDGRNVKSWAYCANIIRKLAGRLGCDVPTEADLRQVDKKPCRLQGQLTRVEMLIKPF